MLALAARGVKLLRRLILVYFPARRSGWLSDRSKNRRSLLFPSLRHSEAYYSREVRWYSRPGNVEEPFD